LFTTLNNTAEYYACKELYVTKLASDYHLSVNKCEYELRDCVKRRSNVALVWLTIALKPPAKRLYTGRAVR